MTLVERIEAVRATDHAELDAIDLAIAEWCYNGGAPGLVNYDPEMWLIRNGGWARSIDAAVALAERVVGGDHALTLLQDVLADHNSGGLATSDIPLRLCAAILRAKEGEG
jgi:hypothetical protein